ncbi:MAG: MutT/NUDIX family protein, partial [Bryobacterales bacterium]|nr:MutT/NUDIX family protein [Bryobacterales bacterium]
MKLLRLLVSLLLPLMSHTETAPFPDLKTLEQMSARFARTPLEVDTSHLSAGDRQALVKLIAAAHAIDDVFLKQYWSGNPALYARLQH